MQDIHPFKPVIETPIFSDTEMMVFGVLLGCFIAVGLAWIAMALIRKYRVPSTAYRVTEMSVADARREALAALEKSRVHIAAASWKPFYLAATEIVKGFLSQAHETDVRGRTTRELLQDPSLPDITRLRLGQFVRRMDEAKFANAGLGAGPAQAMYDAVRLFLIHEG